MFKKENGITLVALVVTIIVLLILAGVAISLTIGNNGLFIRAQDAAEKWGEGEENTYKAMNEAVDVYDSVYDRYINKTP